MQISLSLDPGFPLINVFLYTNIVLVAITLFIVLISTHLVSFFQMVIYFSQKWSVSINFRLEFP